ncbi:MAG: DMT family transporter [Granulosicoccaceae bacterium]
MQQQRLIGIVLVTLSAVTFSTAGLFVKGVSAGSYAIVFWRSLGAIAAIFTYTYCKGQLKNEQQNFGSVAWAVSIVGALGTLAFVPAFKYTSIANVSIIYAAAPFVSAGIAYLWMREIPARATLYGSVVVVLGVAIIFGESVGQSQLLGDLLALIMTAFMALVVCIYRRYPNTSTLGPAAMMALLLVPVGFVFDTPFNIPTVEIGLCLLFGLVFALASVTLAEGARRLPAAQTSLLSALEMPLAPIWALLLFSETPALSTLIGGLLIAVAVVAATLKN